MGIEIKTINSESISRTDLTILGCFGAPFRHYRRSFLLYFYLTSVRTPPGQRWLIEV
ncbi:hypothetical protein TorRG33x02_032220 [Trema orientale]|uniref:Uncharacterized protein n=1 Tax=Trema orientale TaxID=63057 RepID=A0A2P5FTE5_TREOI|nr:hypothetical protein TorRG33x02_032220 [Trema orientale]